jgi:hypothetical protein
VKLPATVESAATVNAIVTRSAGDVLDVSLHGTGSVQITGPDGRTRELQLRGEQTLTLQ